MAYLRVALWILVVAAGVALLAYGGSLIWEKSRPRPVQDPPPPSAGVITPTQTAPIPRSDPSLPEPSSEIAGRVAITLRDTVKPEDTVGTVRVRQIWVNVPTDPTKPPKIQSTSPLQATFSSVEDPWVSLTLRPLVGASVTQRGHPNIWAGLKIVRLFKRVGIGVGADLDAAGIWAGVEIFREWTIAAEWNPLQYGSDATRWSFQFAYRF